MNNYLVTTELITPLWKKIFRFFRLIKKRDEFAFTLSHDFFIEGEILTQPECRDLLILKKI